MAGEKWSRLEVEATVADYFSMLALYLSGQPFSKAEHRRNLARLLQGRSEPAIERKHSNISAVLSELGFFYLPGYKPLSHYQELLADVVADRLSADKLLQDLAAADADRPMVVPEVKDILSVVADAPHIVADEGKVAEAGGPIRPVTTNYVAREAHNRALGLAGEKFVIDFERARLIRAGCERLADRIEHTSKENGDGAGYDILSFEENGAERLIEVKTTKHGIDTPFYVSRNEVAVSERESERYFVYRMFEFRASPRLYTLRGSISASCRLAAVSFLAEPR